MLQMLTKFFLNDEYFDCLDSDFIPERGQIIQLENSDNQYLIKDIKIIMDKQGPNASMKQVIYLKDI